MKVESAIVYPYNLLFAPVLRLLQKQGKFDIKSAVTIGMFYQENADASYIDEGASVGIPLKSDLSSELSFADVMIWAYYDYSNNRILFDRVKESIVYALKKKKRIICCQRLTSEERAFFECFSKAQGCDFLYMVNTTNERCFSSGSTICDSLDVPLIVVSGIYHHCQVFDAVCSLFDLFQKDNYTISAIAPSSSAEVLGMHSFPAFFQSSMPECEKMKQFRETVAEIQSKEKPDAMIVGIPNNLLMLNGKYPGDYGLMAYEVFNAIHPDFSIVCVDCNTYSPMFETQLLSLMKYRYNADVDAICISNIGVNYESLELDLYEVPEYNIYSLSDVRRKIKEFGDKTLYPIANNDSMCELKNKIVHQLT